MSLDIQQIAWGVIALGSSFLICSLGILTDMIWGLPAWIGILSLMGVLPLQIFGVHRAFKHPATIGGFFNSFSVGLTLFILGMCATFLFLVICGVDVR